MDEKIFLLSIDGGGVRGKIAATVLSLLEAELKKSISDIFNLYAGTSTGALIVLGITANNFTGEAIRDLYNEKNLQSIFKKSFWGYLPFRLGAKYQRDGKRLLLEKIFGNTRFLELKKTTLVTAYDFLNNKGVVFKSSGGTDSNYNPCVAEVADATTAAPTYFPTVVTSEVPPRNLIDGGIAANNPSVCLLSEALQQGRSLKNIRLLALGTGYKLPVISTITSSKSWGALEWFNNGLIEEFMLGNSSLAEYQCKTLLGDNYLRIDGPLGLADEALDNISPDNLKKLEELGVNWYQQNRDKLIAFISS